jgi:hypothetical protein
MVDSPARSSDVVARAPSAVSTTETSIHERTLIAIADTDAISADGESGVSEDFGYYLGKAADSLRARGIVLRTHLSRRLRLRLGEHTHEWELPAGITCGYIWINASLKPQTAWGVLTDNELLQWTRD